MRVKCSEGYFGNLADNLPANMEARQEFTCEFLGVSTGTSQTTTGPEYYPVLVVCDDETGLVVAVPLRDWTVSRAEMTLQDAAAIHCRYWGSPAWEWARAVRDQIIDREDPEWPHEAFWAEVDKIWPHPE